MNNLTKCNYKNVFLSKEQFLIDNTTDFIQKIPSIVTSINLHSGINYDWTLPQNKDLLTEKQLIKIQEVVAKDAQPKLVSTITPYIKPQLKKLFGDRLKYNIRVSAQIKGRWNENVIKDNRVGKWIDGLFYEDEKRPNIAFPTRGHQDLDNNGNRSSHTLIFYFQLTHPFEHASLLEYAPFEKETGLMPFLDTKGYSNEILADVLDKLQWRVAGIIPGNINLMTGLTIHRSTLKADIPRIALNVKIQPTSLDYLNFIYGYDLSPCHSGDNVNTKLSVLYEILKDASRKNPLLLFETAITAILLGDFQKMHDALNAFCLFDVSELQMNRIALGAVLRKIMLQVKISELHYLDNPLSHVAPLSCAASILETVGESNNTCK
jgi:hypothetical protein